MSGNNSLPAGFTALEPFAEYWAAETLSARDTRRLDSTPEQRQSFYVVALEEAQKALEYLDCKPLTSFDDADHRLMRLMQSLVHVALAVEVQRDAEHIHARGARRLPITHSHSD